MLRSSFLKESQQKLSLRGSEFIFWLITTYPIIFRTNSPKSLLSQSKRILWQVISCMAIGKIFQLHPLLLMMTVILFLVYEDTNMVIHHLSLCCHLTFLCLLYYYAEGSDNYLIYVFRCFVCRFRSAMYNRIFVSVCHEFLIFLFDSSRYNFCGWSLCSN